MEPSNGVDATADRSRFSDLPDQVVHHIFSFLEPKDMIRASAVSPKWRYWSTSMPHLNLHYRGLMFGMLQYFTFKEVVNWILLNHDESVSIKSCRLSCLNNDDDHSVYRWLYVLAQKHVQELHLNLPSEDDNPFALPHCLLASDSLEALELELQTSVLKIPSYAGSSQLKSLKLVTTHLPDQHLFQNFISSCPLLENLCLEGCELHGFKVLDFSSRNLKKLVIKTDRLQLEFFKGVQVYSSFKRKGMQCKVMKI